MNYTMKKKHDWCKNRTHRDNQFMTYFVCHVPIFMQKKKKTAENVHENLISSITDT